MCNLLTFAIDNVQFSATMCNMHMYAHPKKDCVFCPAGG